MECKRLKTGGQVPSTGTEKDKDGSQTENQVFFFKDVRFEKSIRCLGRDMKQTGTHESWAQERPFCPGYDRLKAVTLGQYSPGRMKSPLFSLGYHILRSEIGGNGRKGGQTCDQGDRGEPSRKQLHTIQLTHRESQETLAGVALKHSWNFKRKEQRK